ncbi:MAG: hypothetical protein ACK55I_32390, partial [bacterium]
IMDSNVTLRFFSWNPIASFGGDLEFHATEEEARASAESALEDALDGEFDSDAEGICWGEVRGFAEFEKVHEHGKGTPCWDEAYDEGEQECSEGISLEWDYALSGKIVDVDTEQKKLEARVAELESELAALKARIEA